MACDALYFSILQQNRLRILTQAIFYKILVVNILCWKVLDNRVVQGEENSETES